MRGLSKFLLWFTLIVGTICGVLYATLLDVWEVPGDDAAMITSIAPNLAGGDILLISRHGEPASGELLRCDDPDSPGRFVIGRMIGSPKDKVEFTGDAIRINGFRKPSPRACGTIEVPNATSGGTDEYNCREEDFAGREFRVLTRMESSGTPSPVTTEVDSGKIFLVSDNRPAHVDSRDYGAVDPATCKHIVFRLFGAAGWLDAKTRMTLL